MQSSPMVLSRDTGSNQLKPEQHMIEPRFYSEVSNIIIKTELIMIGHISA